VILTFRPIKVWPEGWPSPDSDAPWSKFKATYQSTLELLDRELDYLGAKECTLQVDATERDCRLDGQLRADAKVGYRGCILSFDTLQHGTLTYSCDAFDAHSGAWKHNLRAIALGLEALRKVERYGIANRGQQYAGYRELGTGIALGPGAMSKDEAAVFIGEAAGWTVPPDPMDPTVVALAYKTAAKRLHPDAGGDAEQFKRLQEAKAVLDT
jgi:hypothetical protein